MSDQDSSLTIAAPAVETSEAPSGEWFVANRTTPEEQENLKWIEGRNSEITAKGALKQTLSETAGLYEAYREQLDALSTDERAELLDKTADEIVADLDSRADAEREQKRQQETAAKEAAERADANFRALETPELREVRKAMKSAYQAASSLDEQIAELQRLNEMRNDPTAEGWEDMPTDTWILAREGKLGSFSPDIAALIQEKQARLQEAALHQNAYHEGMRANQAHYVPPPIGQITGDDGRPVEISRADITTLVQLERDAQAHQQRVLEATKNYPDWIEAGRNAIAAGVDITDSQAAFVRSLPNSADVTYYLITHPNETVALSRMPSRDATRELINISHKVARPGASAEPRKTTAPKPPSPVGGRSSRGFDVNDESLSEDEWMRQRNEQLARKGKH